VTPFFISFFDAKIKARFWIARAFLVVLALVLPLTACGKKPGTLDAPPDVASSTAFPRVYPDPNTDPAP
jgi:predicted small lipoprotein YifL